MSGGTAQCPATVPALQCKGNDHQCNDVVTALQAVIWIANSAHSVKQCRRPKMRVTSSLMPLIRSASQVRYAVNYRSVGCHGIAAFYTCAVTLPPTQHMSDRSFLQPQTRHPTTWNNEERLMEMRRHGMLAHMLCTGTHVFRKPGAWTSINLPSQRGLECHRAAFIGDEDALKDLCRTAGTAALSSFDSHGNTVSVLPSANWLRSAPRFQTDAFFRSPNVSALSCTHACMPV